MACLEIWNKTHKENRYLKRSLPLSSSDDKQMAGQEPKDMTIKTNKSAHDDRSFSGMYASQDLWRIPRNNLKKKISETSITGNKYLKIKTTWVKKQRLLVALKEQKIHQYWLHLHIKVSKTTKLVQMIRHVIPIHVKLVFIEAMMLVLKETWMQKIKIKKMMNTSTLRQ